MKSLVLRFLFLSFALFLSVVTCRAQSAESAALGGVVQDKSGAVIPNVDVKVTNVDSGVTRQVTTDRTGSFQVPGLLPGNYDIHLEHPGFADVEVTGIKLEVAGNRQLEIKLPVGHALQTVTVSAASIGMNTTDGSVSTVIDQKLISELPLNGRSLDTLFLLTPGVVPTGNANTDGGAYSVNGQRASGNQLTVDGVSGNLYVGAQTGGGTIATPQTGLAGSTYATSASGGTNGLLPVDAIEEYRIQTSTYSAEYGRSPGGQIQIRTRGGTNDFHGSAFEYFRNQVMDATDWFVKYDDLKQAPLRMNDFGGTFSGPIVKRRLFFFGAHETLDLDQPNNVTIDVPSAYAKQVVSESFAPFLNAYPNGNAGTATTSRYPMYTDVYNEEYATQIIDHSTSLRLDAALPHGYEAFFRFDLAPSHSVGTEWNYNTSATNLDTYTAGLTKSLSTHLLNELTLNFGTNNGHYAYSLQPINGANPSGFDQFCQTTSSGSTDSVLCAAAGLRGWGTLYDGSSTAVTLHQWNLVDTFQWAIDSHSISFGADYRRLSTAGAAFTHNLAEVGSLSGPSALTGSTFDVVSTQSATVANEVIPVDNLSLFIQDDWRGTDRLTINYGLRWEYNPPISDGHGGPLAIAGDIDNLADLEPAPSGTPLYKTEYTAFAPRLGFAYQLQNKPRFATVLRAGAGIFYDTGQAASTASVALNSYPYELNATEDNVPLASLNFTSLQQSAAAQALPQARLYVLDPRLSLPYTAQWSLAVEQQLYGRSAISATYVGADGEQLASTNNSFGLAPALVTATGQLALLSNHGRSNYQALQMQATIRTASWIDGIIAYTYSHNIDNGSSDFTGSVANATDYRASADDDIRHIFSAGISFTPKAISGPEAVRILTKGWVLNTFTRLQTASPLSVFSDIGYGEYLSALNSYVGFADRVPGVPVYLRGARGANGHVIPGGIQLNPSAFTNLPVSTTGEPLRDGNSGRNAYRLFGLREFDLSAGRRFQLTERLGLEFKAEAFNILNTPTFADVETTLGEANFGQAQNTYAGYTGGNGGLTSAFQIGGPRNMQLTARITF
jgi:hypothetical protein